MNLTDDRAKSIFLNAAEIAVPEERRAYIETQCGDDQSLRNEVEGLLRHQQSLGSFLEAPPAGLGATVLREPQISERPGTVIGPYKLLQQIGEGGMGVVFMAEQSEPIQRTVALKIIKPGMDTRQVIARFEAERQALAMMDHPNIAKVLDAGTTESGRPYFVMELVKGVPITRYCDEKHMPLRARLELLLPVCQAVQHAHQKGLIHRDIKPSNVLVAEYDDLPVPKVIDFGVAKATAHKLTDRTMFTEFGQIVGTVEYMSPEQAKLNQLDIDTRSDIYSLGVLLYELLTGSTPFGRKRLQETAFDEMLRIIREEEPPKPSTRLSTAEGLPSIAANRSLEPLKLNRLVRGELDWIVMKALEKDRNRRYETANGLAADVQRYLNDEPVEARPAAQFYRLRKFVGRNKAGTLAGAAIVAALLIGLTLATFGFVQARSQAAKATAINNLLQEMLKSGSPSAANGKEYTVREMLQDFSTDLSEQIRDQPEVEAAIRATIGKALLELGQPDEAGPHVKRALELRRRLFGENHPDVASSYSDCARLVMYASEFAEAERLLRQSLAIYERLGIENRETTNALQRLGFVLREQMRYRDAEVILDRGVEMTRKHNLQSELAAMLHEQAGLALATPGEAPGAESLARQSLELTRQIHGSKHPDTAWVLWTLAAILAEEHNNIEAGQCLREALAIFRDHFGDAHYLVHALREDLKMVLMNLGDQSAAAALQTEQSANDVAAMAEYDKAVALYPNSPWRLMHRGSIHALQGDMKQADLDLKRAAELTPENSTLVYMRAGVCFTMNNEAGFRQASLALAESAERGSDRAAAFYAAMMFVMAPNSAIDGTQALKFAEKCVDARPEDGVAIGLLGATLFRVGRYEEAAKRLTECLDVEEGHFNKIGTQAFGYLFLAMTYHRLEHFDEAKDWLNRAVEIIEARQGTMAYWPSSMFADRLRQETEQLLGVERKAAVSNAAQVEQQPIERPPD